MKRWLVRAIIMTPAFVVLVAFAVANHQPVTVSFNPFDSSDSDLAVTVPLYQVGFAVLIAGVVLGGFAAWLMQGKRRRIGSRLAAENATIRTELAHLKRQTARPENGASMYPAGSANKRLPAAVRRG